MSIQDRYDSVYNSNEKKQIQSNLFNFWRTCLIEITLCTAFFTYGVDWIWFCFFVFARSVGGSNYYSASNVPCSLNKFKLLKIVSTNLTKEAHILGSTWESFFPQLCCLFIRRTNKIFLIVKCGINYSQWSRIIRVNTRQWMTKCIQCYCFFKFLSSMHVLFRPFSASSKIPAPSTIEKQKITSPKTAIQIHNKYLQACIACSSTVLVCK